jgi:hypothetical protein
MLEEEHRRKAIRKKSLLQASGRHRSGVSWAKRNVTTGRITLERQNYEPVSSRMIGNKTPEDRNRRSLEEEIRALAKSRGCGRARRCELRPRCDVPRTRREPAGGAVGFADLDDLDDYVPELDDYEPGLEGEFLPCEDEPPTPSPSRRSSVAKQAAPRQRFRTGTPRSTISMPDDEDVRRPAESRGHRTIVSNTRRGPIVRRPESPETARRAGPSAEAGVDDPEEEDSPGLVKVPVPRRRVVPAITVRDA